MFFLFLQKKKLKFQLVFFRNFPKNVVAKTITASGIRGFQHIWRIIFSTGWSIVGKRCVFLIGIFTSLEKNLHIHYVITFLCHFLGFRFKWCSNWSWKCCPHCERFFWLVYNWSIISVQCGGEYQKFYEIFSNINNGKVYCCIYDSVNYNWVVFQTCYSILYFEFLYRFLVIYFVLRVGKTKELVMVLDQ